MATPRRASRPMRMELPDGSVSPANDAPPISALFLIYFDIKAGYTVSWKRSSGGIELEGVVEYKSLPSGLHTVREDLIYFIHDRYAGVSAFINVPDAESARNARMIAVGVLVPLSYGRLGRSWKHAEALKAMRQKLVTDPSKTQLLESYWDAHKAPQDGLHLPTESSSESLSTLAQNPAGRQPGKPKHNRNRSASDGTALLRSGHSLSVNHPAWSLSSLATTFGPLIFRIYRAALLRKRILLSCHAPVRQVCDFGKDPSIPGRFYLADPPRTVYGLSVISNIPIAVSNLLSESAPPRRIRPLFTIGVHDIPYLEEDLRASKPAGRSTANEAEISEDLDPAGHGWIACTTDGILAVKETLYDILITLPPPQTEHDQERAWPKVQSSQGVHLMATQRDLRRYNIFKWALSQSSGRTENSQQKQNTEEDSRQSIPPQLTSWNPALFDYRTDTDSIVEPLSWSALAYSGFMWWASAGERQISMDDEFEQDSALLEGLGFERPSLRPSIASPDAISSAQNTDCTANHEMAIIAYFHRLTTSILTVLSDIIDATDSDDEREDARLTNSGDDEDLDGPAVFVSSADITKMGLDSWSKTDQEFIEELVRLYFGRKARVEGNSVDVCGVRIC